MYVLSENLGLIPWLSYRTGLEVVLSAVDIFKVLYPVGSIDQTTATLVRPGINSFALRRISIQSETSRKQTTGRSPTRSLVKGVSKVLAPAS